MTRPAAYALNLYRGDSYAWRFVIWLDEAKTQPADLAGVTAAAQIRDRPGGAKLIELACAVSAPNLVDVNMAPADWSESDMRSGAWDLQLTWADGSVVTIVAGAVHIVTDVTVP